MAGGRWEVGSGKCQQRQFESSRSVRSIRSGVISLVRVGGEVVDGSGQIPGLLVGFP